MYACAEPQIRDMICFVTAGKSPRDSGEGEDAKIVTVGGLQVDA